MLFEHVLAGQLFVIHLAVPAADEVNSGAARLAHDKVYVLALGTSCEVTRLGLSGLNVPRLHSVAVKFIDNDLELVVRTNKHVVGSAIEYDRFLVGDHDFVRIGAASSGLGTCQEPGVGNPIGTVLHVDDIGVGNQINLTVLERIAGADVQVDKRLAVFGDHIALVALNHGLHEPLGILGVDVELLGGDGTGLVGDGNSVVLVDHDTQILSESDWIIEMGPEAGASGGYVIAEGTVEEIKKNDTSCIGPFLSGTADVDVRTRCSYDALFDYGTIRLSTDSIHTVKPLDVEIPKGRLSVITGVSGSGKTTLVLESLAPALKALCEGGELPGHVKSIKADGIRQVKLIDATPIGINVRSTVATYANVHDELRKVYAKTQKAKEKGYKAGDFSYNTGRLRCPVCDGTGVISLDVQFLPDVDIPCPECRGSRYSKDADEVKVECDGAFFSISELMAMDVNTAVKHMKGWKVIYQRLKTLQDLGLGYLTLGEETPSLSGGEAQRLKLASEMGRRQSDSVFIFDEPTIGLHPLDVQSLLKVFQTLIDFGATVIVIEHDLDVIRSADYIIDMGPGGGDDGGRIVAAGTPDMIKAEKESITGRYI